jgi:hypothetical protein
LLKNEFEKRLCIFTIVFVASHGLSDPNGNHGLFTYALLKGLPGDGGGNRDGQVVLSELYEFASRFVEENRDKKIGNQTPQLTAPKELEEMVLAAQ